MTCAHCPASKAPYRWTLTACANAGRKRVYRLCNACDVKLNALVLRFVRDPKVAEKMAKYRERA